MKTIILKPIATVGKYLMLMGRTFSRPERFRVYFKQYVSEMVQLGVNSSASYSSSPFSLEPLSLSKSS